MLRVKARYLSLGYRGQEHHLADSGSANGLRPAFELQRHPIDP